MDPLPPAAVVGWVTRTRDLLPESMDTVDHSGHVLLVIDVCGLREEGLGVREQLVTICRPLASQTRVRVWESSHSLWL